MNRPSAAGILGKVAIPDSFLKRVWSHQRYLPKRRGIHWRPRFESLESRSMMAADLLSFDPGTYDSDHLLVQFRSAESAYIGERFPGARVARQVTTDGWFQLEIEPGNSMRQVLSSLQSDPDIVLATPDFRIEIERTPNDPSFSSQWGLENSGIGGTLDADIDASQAWDFGTSSSVVVAVIDTGIDYNHIDLATNIWRNTDEIAGNGIDDDANGYVDDIRGWNFVGRNNNPMDDNGHGTHVAGTIGAIGNNGIGVTGVAWNASLMALKFLAADGSGLLSNAVSAIDYARINGAQIINASWGGGGFSSALQSAIQRFQSAGGIFVAAAGNEASNNTLVPSFPANYAVANVVSVAASTQSDTLANFSNYGTNVDIAAPGNSILSTVPGNGYARYSGTSMATPHVAGAMALLWSQSPSMTATQVIDLVMQNTDRILTDRTVYGRLNIGKAAIALRGSQLPDTTHPHVVSALWNVQGATPSIDVTFSEPMTPGSLNTASILVNGPAGPIAVSSMVPLSAANTQFRINLSSLSAPGTYTLQVLPTILDAAGNRLDQDRDGLAGETPQDIFTSSFTQAGSRAYSTLGPIALQDATNTRVGTTNISVQVPDSFVISDLNVDLSINHTYVGDLRIRLIAPDGTSVQLLNRRGGSRDNIRLLFDDEASASIASVSGNLTGTFRPERALSGFDGKNGQGRWTIEIVDAARLDSGTFQSVTLRFASSSGDALASIRNTNTSQSIDANHAFQSWMDWFDRTLRRSRS